MTEILNLMEVGDWTAAASTLEQLLQRSPHNPQLRYQLGLCRFNLRNFQQACEQFQAAALQSTPSAFSAADRARLYNDWAVCLFHCREPEAAAQRLQEALSIAPDLLEAKLNLGMVEAALSEHQHSGEILDDCLKIDPNSAEAHLYRGVAALLEGKGEQATGEFALAANNGMALSQFNLWPGYAQLAQGNVKAAALLFEQRVSENPDDWHALDALGNALLLAGDADAAISKFEEVLKINPQLAIVRWHLAQAQMLAGKTAEAKNNYTQALNIDPSCIDAEKNLLQQLIESGKLETAMDSVMRLLDVAPQDAELQLLLSRILIAQGKLDEAEQSLQKLIALRPLNSSARAQLGHLYFFQSRLAEADEQYAAACELGADDGAMFLNWGKSLNQLGFNELAVEKFQKAAQIDPFNADVYDLWGSTLKSLGRFAEAAQVYKQAADYVF